MYSRNISALFLHLVADGRLKLDFDDEIVRDTCITREAQAPSTEKAASH